MQRIVSLEITSTHIRAAEIDKPFSKKPTLVKFEEVALPPGVADNSEIYAPEEVTEALNLLWQEAKFSTKRVALGISNRKIVVKDFLDAPYIPLDKIRKTLTYEVADILPSDVSNYILDFYPLEKVENQARVRGLIIAAQKDTVEKIMATLTLADLKVEFVDFSPFSHVRTARKVFGEGGRYFIVNVGSDNAEITAVKDGTPRMIRVIPNGVPARSSAGRHAGISDASQSFSGDSMPSAHITPTDAFLGSLRSTIDYYTRRGGVVDNIYLIGEGAVSEELNQKIVSAIDVPASRITLEETIDFSKKYKVNENRPYNESVKSAMVSTIGTGIRGGK